MHHVYNGVCVPSLIYRKFIIDQISLSLATRGLVAPVILARNHTSHPIHVHIRVFYLAMSGCLKYSIHVAGCLEYIHVRMCFYG